MSLYDKASLVFSGKAAAGKDGKAYNIKPVEKLKVDELITNNKLLTSDGWAFSDSNITVANGKIVFNEPAQYATARWDTDVFVEGKTYKISFKVEDFGGGASNSKLLAQQANNTQIDTNIDRDGKYSFYYTPGAPDGTNNQNRFQLKTVTDSVKAKVSDFSIKEVEQKANDFTFTRGSNLTATLEGADGLIKKGRENLLTHSNSFTESGSWDKAPEITLTASQSGYEGSTRAFKMATSSSGKYIDQNVSTSGVQTFSIYAKKGTENGIFLRANGGDNPRAFFRLDTGAVGNTAGGSAFISADIDSIGSDWHRCSLTVDETVNEVRVYVADNANGFPSSGDIFIQNAQLEAGLVATPYIDRTGAAYSTAGVLENEPRYDYSGGDATLLLEPLRRNVVDHSEYLGAWSFSGNANSVFSFTQNHSISPDGTKNASKYSATANYRSIRKILTLETSTNYVFSFYVKNIDAARARYRVFNTDDGSGSGDDVIPATNYFSSVSTSQWTRIEVPFTTDAVGTSYGVYLADGLTVTNSGDSGGNILFWGAQVEKGTYATSYIPTYGSAATREGEAHQSLSSFRCELDNPLSKKYTFILDLRVDNLERPTASFDDIFVTRDSSGNNNPFRLEGYAATELDPDEFSLRVFAYSTKDSGAALSSPHANGIQLGQRNKIAIMFDETVGIKVFLNGNSTPLEQVLIGDAFSTNSEVTLKANSFYDVKFLEGGSNSRSKTLLYGVQAYDAALSDAECVSLTTIS